MTCSGVPVRQGLRALVLPRAKILPHNEHLAIGAEAGLGTVILSGHTAHSTAE